MKPSFAQRLRYLFDRLLLQGTPAMVGLLFVLSLILLFLGSAVVLGTGLAPAHADGSQMNFLEVTWYLILSLLNINAASDIQVESVGLSLIRLEISIGGIFLISMLGGVLGAGIQARSEALRKGRSIVLEKEHIIILGWSAHIFSILDELMTASQDRKNARIVILADKDKVEMEDQIMERVEPLGTTRIICRSGNPLNLIDLEIVNLNSAKSVIILSPEQQDPDVRVIKVLLAIARNPRRRLDSYNVVAEVIDPSYVDFIKMASKRDNIQIVLRNSIISGVLAQTACQPGLSKIYAELFNFEQNRVCFISERTLIGKLYKDALFTFKNASIIGLRSVNGFTRVNPDMKTEITDGDKLIAITKFQNLESLDIRHIDMFLDSIKITKSKKENKPNKWAMLGWNSYAQAIIENIEKIVSWRSSMTVISDKNIDAQVLSYRPPTSKLKTRFLRSNVTDLGSLLALGIQNYHTMIVLADDGLDRQSADARGLITLLQLQYIADQNNHPFSIVSDVVDQYSRQLVESDYREDIVATDQFLGIVIAQLAENPEFLDVLQALLDPKSSTISLKPIHDYINLGRPVNFATVTEAASRNGETTIGYRLERYARDVNHSYGIYINPAKDEQIAFSEGDMVIVLTKP